MAWLRALGGLLITCVQMTHPTENIRLCFLAIEEAKINNNKKPVPNKTWVKQRDLAVIKIKKKMLLAGLYTYISL